MFAASEYMDFSLNNWIGHLLPEMVTSHLSLDAGTINTIPKENFAVIAGYLRYAVHRRRCRCETSIACRKKKSWPWRFRWRKRTKEFTPILARVCGKTFPAPRKCLKRCARRRLGIAAG